MYNKVQEGKFKINYTQANMTYNKQQEDDQTRIYIVYNGMQGEHRRINNSQYGLRRTTKKTSYSIGRGATFKNK